MNKIAKKIVAMANFGRYNGFRFFIYSSDVKERMHVHAEKNGKIAKFWLEPVEVNKRANFNEVELLQCRKTIIEHEKEFKQKFKDEQEKFSSGAMKKAYVINSRVKTSLPIVEKLLKTINSNLIKNVVPDEDENACLITFKRVGGVEPWIEICYFKDRKQQHLRLEIELKNGRIFEYETFISIPQQQTVVKNVNDFIEKAYFSVI